METIYIINKIISLIQNRRECESSEIPSFYIISTVTDQKIKAKFGEKEYEFPETVGWVLYNKDEITEYIALTDDLYDKVIENNTISRKTFRKNIVEKLLISSNLNEKAIKNKMAEIEEKEIVSVRKIFGVTLNHEQKIQYGNYIFIKRGELSNYLKQKYGIESTFEIHDNYEKADFVYVLIKNNAKDRIYAEEKSDEEVKKITNYLRFMYQLLFSNSVFYIDDYPFYVSMDNTAEVMDNQLYDSSNNNRKGILPLDSDLVILPKWMLKVWGIISKDNHTSLEEKIIISLNWIGKALAEKDYNLACTEVAFAFESLLMCNEGLISLSISAQLSEEYALICGETFDEKTQKEKSFKDFYSARCGVAHGGKKNVRKETVLEGLKMFYDVLSQIVLSDKFANCQSPSDILDVTKKLKYGYVYNCDSESE